MEESATTPPAPTRPPEELHWGIVYLREDIQDIRGEIRGVHNRIDQVNQSLSNRIDQVSQTLSNRIDETAQQLRSEMGEGFQQVHNRIDQTNQRLDEKYELLIKRLDNRFLWTITTMIALSGLAVTILKL